MPPMSFLLIALTALALADAPEVVVSDDSWIVGTMTVDAPMDEVRALVHDPVKLSEIDPTDDTVKVEDKGACQRLTMHINHPIAPLDYVVDSCPNPTGRTEKLVSSERGMSEFAMQWKLMPDGDARTKVEYRIRTVTSLMVPQFVVNRQSRKSVETMLTKVQEHLES